MCGFSPSDKTAVPFTDSPAATTAGRPLPRRPKGSGHARGAVDVEELPGVAFFSG